MTATQRISSREWIAVVAVLLLAFALRTIDLARVPAGMHNDEVVAAKFTEEVMNGRYAIFYPEDTGSEPLHYYFSAPIMSVFGKSVWAARLPSIVLSMIAMCVIWALARRLFGPIAALTALAGFAITFWTVAFGRIVSPVVMIVPLGALSAYFFWRAFSDAGQTCPRPVGLRWRVAGHGAAGLHGFTRAPCGVRGIWRVCAHQSNKMNGVSGSRPSRSPWVLRPSLRPPCLSIWRRIPLTIN